jgi:hypothetical protein
MPVWKTNFIQKFCGKFQLYSVSLPIRAQSKNTATIIPTIHQQPPLLCCQSASIAAAFAANSPLLNGFPQFTQVSASIEINFWQAGQAVSRDSITL